MQINLPKRCSIGYHADILKLVHQTLDQHHIDHAFVPSIYYDCPELDPDKMTPNTLMIFPHCDQVTPMVADVWIRKGQPFAGNPMLILTSVEGVEKDYPDLPKNYSYIHIGGDMLFQRGDYPLIAPQKEKNPDMGRFWISLSQTPKSGRILTACCLLGHDLGFDHGHRPESGVLRISPDFFLEVPNAQAQLVNLKNFSSWSQCYVGTHSLNTRQQAIMQKGFELLCQGKNGGTPSGAEYSQVNGSAGVVSGPDNATNFQKFLRPLYANSLVELINETTFFNQAIFVTEKFLNSVYGYNLPIVFSNAGTVEYLRQNGFDMCDDVVDHSYDLIQDPLQRIFCAVESNKRLLTDKAHAWQAWKKAVPRLDANYEFARDRMYDHFTNKVKIQLEQFIQQFKKV